ncbi:MAG: prephenate dehydratase [Phycisphaerales bacterium]|nr:prephenate dehydratase [Phycisphaerales bacterium]
MAPYAPAVMTSLQDLRKKIDELDEKIVRLLNERAEAAVEIGRLKASTGTAVFAPDRERAVLNRVAGLSAGPLSKESLSAIYRELMSASFALERPPRVGYLGPKGSFSHEAAMGKFGASIEYEPLLNIHGIFDAMDRGHIDYGVVPVENNSSGGVVLDTLDAFVEHDVQICNEIQRAIHQNLMAKCPWDEIQTVHSKPEAFKQCQNWLAETGFGAKVVPAPSTSKAAEKAAEEPGVAAIGSALAAQLYGLQILAANIEDNPKNATRFFVLGKDSAKRTGDDQTSLMLVTAHKAGALVDVLLVFQKRGINMTMITSRPSAKTDLEYNFFVDLDGHQEDKTVKAALEEARTHCRTIRVLGSYPKSTEVIAA